MVPFSVTGVLKGDRTIVPIGDVGKEALAKAAKTFFALWAAAEAGWLVARRAPPAS